MESRKRKSAIDNYIDSLEDPPEKLQRTANFYHGLKQFYRRKWNAPLKLPHVQGVELNLFRLYDTVMAMGGWQKVSLHEKWSDVAEILGVGDDVVCGDHAIKLAYMRYLSKYEQVETIGDIDDMMDGELSRGRGRQSSFFATNECPVSLGRTTEYVRRDERGNPSTEPEYSRVIRSLLSGLPNEVDFGVNVCTLLSHPGPRLLRLSHAPHIPTVLVALVGIFDDEDCDLSDLYPVWAKNSGRDYAAFWANCGASVEFLEKFCPMALEENVDKDSDIFHGLAADYDVRNPMSWRLNQIATIIRNFSFEAINRVTLTQSWALMKFVFLCAASRWVPLYTAAMDTLSNIATDINLTHPRMADESGFAILQILKEGVLSSDKFKVIRAMEILTGLCMYEGNEAVITDFVTGEMIERIFNVVCVKDIMMCVYALECLYQFSEMGDVTCDLICKNTSFVQQLVSMTTLEAVSFGQAGLAGMKVVEYQPPPGMFPGGQQMQHPQMHPGMQMMSHQMQQRMHMTPNVQQRHMVAHPMQSGTPISHMPPPRSQPMPPPMQSQPPPPGTPNSAGERESRVDQLTEQWIRQNCQADPNCVTPRGELYAAYVDDLRNQFHSLSGSLAMFSNIMKQIHTQVQFRMADNGLMMVAQGIRLCKPHKLAPAASAQANPPIHPVSQPMNGTSHPIMKQMLTNPPPQNAPPPTEPSGINGAIINGRSYSSDSSGSHTPEPLTPIDKDTEMPEVKPEAAVKQVASKTANKENIAKPKKEESEEGVAVNGKHTKGEQENGVPAPPRELMCEWDGCGELFSTAGGVLVHCSKEHMIDEIQPCKWPNCDGTPRNRWSLITHIQDHHATEGHLRQAANRRADGQAPAQPPAYRTDIPRDIPQHPGYSKHAAIDAIRRHAFNFLPRDITDEPEGPVTKSIRLTSCLILRNLARYSQEGRHILRRHERHLCWLALSRLESSHAISQLLAELHTVMEPAVST